MPRLAKTDQYKLLRDEIHELKSDSMHTRIIMDHIEDLIKVMKTDIADIRNTVNKQIPN